jgi:pimeloyl-ACP methyl ester carboxylesterase
MIDLKFSDGVRQARIVALVSCLSLSACMTLTVDERIAFAPPKREAGPAVGVADLQSRWAATLNSRAAEGLLKTQSLPDGALRITYLKPQTGRTEISPPMVVRHGFIGEGQGRVAWSLFTGIGEDNQERGPDRPLVVHCAGNAGDRYNSAASYATKAMPWADVLVFDYPGYGDTPGPASASAFEAASKALETHVGGLSRNRKLVFWGHSLGGFVCSRLAATTPGTDGLVLETTAPNAAAVAKAWTPSYARVFVRTSVVPSLASYDVIDASTQVQGPVLVLGAAKDEVLPVTLARQIADGLKSRNANVTYVEFADARHMNVSKQPTFNETIANFFKSVESQS